MEGTSIMMTMTVQGGDVRDCPPLLGSTTLGVEQSYVSLLGLHSTAPTAWAAKRHKGIFSQSWKQEIQDQGVMGLVFCVSTLRGL